MSKMTWIPQKLIEEQIKNKKPVRSSLSEEGFEQIFRKAASECAFSLNKLTIESNHDGVIETEIPTNNYHEIIVRYNPANLRPFSDEELLALCRHEVFHPITMKDTTSLSVMNGEPAFVDYQAEIYFSYDEMINYKEYVKKFPNDQQLHSAKSKHYTNFSIIFLSTKHLIDNNSLPHTLEPYKMALSIYQDAVYNFFENNKRLIEWTDEHDAQAIYKFWEWIHEDFDYISNNTTIRSEVFDLLQIPIGLSMSVNIAQAFSSNDLNVYEDFNSNLSKCRTRFNEKKYENLIDKWENRFLGAPYTF